MILVTGATGFVGARLVDDLRERGVPLRAISRSAREGHFAVGNIDRNTDWSAALEGVDVVVHLAARVHVMKDSAADPLGAFRAVNLDGTLNLARQAAAAGVRRFVFVSSIKVNGEATPPGQPFTAADMPDPQDAYGKSKLAAEEGLFALGRETGLEVVVVRPPLVYGAGAKGNFGAMARWVEKGRPLPLGAIRHNRRSLVFVGNLTDFLIACALHPSAPGEVFLVSDGQDLSTAELASQLALAQHKSPRLVPVPTWILSLGGRVLGRSAAIDRLVGSLQVDIDKSRTLLGWSPPIPVAEAFGATVRRASGARP